MKTQATRLECDLLQRKFRASRPAAVIRIRVTLIGRPPCITRSERSVTSLVRTSSDLKPCANRMAWVQPSGLSPSTVSATTVSNGTGLAIACGVSHDVTWKISAIHCYFQDATTVAFFSDTTGRGASWFGCNR
jgi:hypothetical protein